MSAVLKITADNPKRRRLNTKYSEEERNWFEGSKEEYLELVAYYKELWDEYYSAIRM